MVYEFPLKRLRGRQRLPGHLLARPWQQGIGLVNNMTRLSDACLSDELAVLDQEVAVRLRLVAECNRPVVELVFLGQAAELLNE